jgi:NAD-dependent SIR2 family protein deacetylase
MNDTLGSLLLGSIASDNLVVFCGAGLSMAPPSSVPSARDVAIDVYEKYRQAIGPILPATIRENLEELCKFAWARGELHKLLVEKLVQWRPFFGNPNGGHFAIADFLGASALRLAITTNFDTLVEEAARALGEDDFRCALDSIRAGVERQHKPYVKIHGCGRVDRDNTLWCKEQLVSGSIMEQRVESCKVWMRSNLPGKDLIFIGFWSDWDYLNQIFEACYVTLEPRLVVLVAPEPAARLQAKAPLLWGWANSGKFQFFHAEESGADFLEDLRRRFSLQFLENMIENAKPTYTALTGNSYTRSPNIDPTLTVEELYSLRRNASGVPETEVTRDKRPLSSMNALGSVQMRLFEAGALLSGSRFVLRSQRIRVIEGAGQALSLVKKRFQSETPPLSSDDIVVCVNAKDDGGVPAHIVRSGGPSTIVRPADRANWMNDERAIHDLAI